MDDWTTFCAAFLPLEDRRKLAYATGELSRPERLSAPEDSDLHLGALRDVRRTLMRKAERLAESATA
jgi:hypothetical protein